MTFPDLPTLSPMFFLLSFCSWIVNAQNDIEGQSLKMVESLSARLPEGLCDTVPPAATLHYGSKE